MCCSPPVPAAYGFGPAVQGGADGADPGRSGKYHARDIRAAGGQREDDQTLLEWTRAHGASPGGM